MTERDLWFGTSGPRDAEIVIVGEAWGFEESKAQAPFVGASGTELTRMLAEAGIDRRKCLLTNVVAAKPVNNEMWRLFDAKELSRKGNPQAEVRGLHPGALVRSECARLYHQINSFPRRLVIACGNYPLWALTDCTGVSSGSEQGRKTPSGIMNWRGSMWHMLKGFESEEYSETKLLPLIHPAAIMRQWSLRAVTIHDLKARVPLALNNDWRHKTKPFFLAPPTFDQCTSKLKFWLRLADSGTKLHLTEDIETIRIFNLITVIGLTDSTSFAMAIPFVKKNPDNTLSSFWTPEQEKIIFRLIRKVNAHPNIYITGQNFIYDTQYFQHWLGVTPRVEFDTMLAQHLLWPGTPKGLDYISSLYCKYHWYWKEDGKEWDLKGKLEDLLVYNCWDLVRTHESAGVLRSLIEAMGQTEQWQFVMNRFYFCLRMMNNGVAIDRKLRARLQMELADAASSIQGSLLRIAPQELIETKSDKPWFRSPSQAKTLFEDHLGIKLPINRATGRPTTGGDALSDLPRKYPHFAGIFSRLEQLRSVEVFKSHFIDAKLDPDGAMRCSFNPAGTETHRLSSSKNAFDRGTNLQNIPKGDE